MQRKFRKLDAGNPPRVGEKRRCRSRSRKTKPGNSKLTQEMQEKEEIQEEDALPGNAPPKWCVRNASRKIVGIVEQEERCRIVTSQDKKHARKDSEKAGFGI
jgi:hypothetical protein